MLLALTLWIAGCDRASSSGEVAAAHAEPPAAAMTNRIDVPPNVRRNLGITFASVERRPVRRTLRVPGRFEYRPDAARDHRATLPGRVELLVEQYQQVEAGQPLFRLDSPRWQELRHEVVEAEGEIRLAEAQLDVARAVEHETRESLRFLDERLVRLTEANVRRVELEAQQQEVRNRLPRLEAETRARQVELAEAREHYASLLKVAASVTGHSVQVLLDAVEHRADDADHDTARWRNLQQVEVIAARAGIVQTLAISPGGWVESGELVLRLVDPRAIRFRADAPQSDLGRLRDGLPVRIAPPQGGTVPLGDAIDGTLRVGLEGHVGERTMPVYGIPAGDASWARPGVTAFLDIFVDGDEQPELAVPASSLVRDGMKTILYRRDPRNPDQVYAVDADLGASDGRWVVVHSGVTDGDEVVLEGAYALTLAGGRRQAPPGYHYHADGTLHKDH
jgi:multidrug efflux pump subunit AcrA (membrane-fusion protein)